ncbi:MAG: DUF481 domain-containing protein [Bacteroidota bacterium]
MKTLFFALILMVASNLISAQVLNIEKRRYADDSTTLLHVDASFASRIYNRTASQENPINFLGLDGGFNIAHFGKTNAISWLNQFNYLRINESAFNSTGYSHLRLNFLRTRKFSYELFGQAQYDRLRLLDYRFLGGGGFRYEAINSKSLLVFLGVGGMYEVERWNDPTTEPEEKVTVDFLKSTNYISLRWHLKEYLNLNSVLYYQTTYDQNLSGFRHRLNIEINLNVSINKTLSFRTTFLAAYENAPIVPITKFIYSISNGIQFNLNQKKSLPSKEK